MAVITNCFGDGGGAHGDEDVATNLLQIARADFEASHQLT